MVKILAPTAILLVVTLLNGCAFSTGADDDAAADSAARSAAQIALTPPLRVLPQPGHDVPADFVLLAWGGVPTATSYQVYFGRDTNPPLVATVEQPSYLLQDVEACTTHYWRIVASNAQAFVSSETWTFTTRCY